MLRIFCILLGVALFFWGFVFFAFFQADERSFFDYLFGRRQGIEPAFNIWEQVDDQNAGLEERFIVVMSCMGCRRTILRQRRRRNHLGKIVQVYPEEVYRGSSASSS